MPLYRFRMLDTFDQVLAIQFSDCADDDAARARAQFLDDATRRDTVEIWSAGRRVDRAKKEACAGEDAG